MRVLAEGESPSAKQGPTEKKLKQKRRNVILRKVWDIGGGTVVMVQYSLIKSITDVIQSVGRRDSTVHLIKLLSQANTVEDHSHKSLE